MRLRTLLLLIIILTGMPACSQQSNQSKPVTIGIVNLSTALDPILDGFKKGMREKGYVEGENITYIYEGATGSIDLLPAAIESLMKQDIDLLVSITTPATFAAKSLLQDRDIPLLFVPTYDPVENGIVESISFTGGNYTGIQTIGFIPKQLEWLVMAVPTISNVFVPHNPNDGASTQALATLQESADLLNINLLIKEVTSPPELLEALANIPTDADTIFMLPDGLISNHTIQIVEAGLAQKLPVSATNPTQVEAGAMIGFGWGLSEVGEMQVTRLADQILHGTSASDLPVETSDFFLIVNQKTANAIDVTISDDVLRQARTIYR